MIELIPWIIIFFLILIFAVINLQGVFFCKKHLLILLAMITVTLAGNFYVLRELYVSIPLCVGMFTTFYCPVIAYVFRREILPHINVRLLHVTTIVYLFNVIICTGGTFRIVLVVLSLVPVVIVIYYAVVKTEVKPIIKLCLYAWYLLMLIVIPVLHFNIIRTHRLVAEPMDLYSINNLIFLSGMFFYICIYGVNLLQILPFRGKDESESDMRERVREQSMLFRDKFVNQPAFSPVTIALSALMIAVIILNRTYGAIPSGILGQWLMLSALILASLEIRIAALFRKRSTQKN